MAAIWVSETLGKGSIALKCSMPTVFPDKVKPLYTSERVREQPS
jgi:hypothetical protein